MDPAAPRPVPALEDALSALGVVVWPMVEFEADDACGAAGSSSSIGARASCATSRRCGHQHLEHIPKLATEWDVSVCGSIRLAATLMEQRERTILFRELATLRADAPINADVDALRWTGPRFDFAAWSARLGTPALRKRASTLAAARADDVR